ncbi:MAG: hypothetical protein AB4290_03020 [Spirulina sp.]
MLIQFTKSSRVAYESLDNTDKEKVKKLSTCLQNDLQSILSESKKLIDLENTYLVKLSPKFRAIIRVKEEIITILEIVNYHAYHSLQQMFISLKEEEKKEEAKV